MQYGFYFDQTRCIGCHTCVISCKDNNDVEAGPASWIRVKTLEKDRFPNPYLAFLFSSCYHCGEPACVIACPVGAITKREEDGIVVVDREKCQGKDKCAVCAPCQVACPAGVDAEGYISLISEGKFEAAIELFRETTPFAGVLGRVCTHPCEVVCEREKVDEAIAICSLKRFMADYELRAGRQKATPVDKTKAEKVAVIGSGPAGLACAYDLVRQGYPVTVFEAAPRSGGLLRYGIPEYRLPKAVLDDEISYIEELGVEVKTNAPVKALDDVFKQGYKAVFIATGGGLSQKMGIPGEDAGGVIYALDFLKQVNSGTEVNLGEKVVVIGGGSVAIDAARMSLRLGAREVHLVCLECRDFTSKDRMPAQEQEIEEADEEGVIIHPCLGIRRILTREGRAVGLETIACVSVRNENGTFVPRFIEEDTALTIEVDNVIIAIGQAVDKSMLPAGLSYTAGGAVLVDPVTQQSGTEGVFAGGDVVSGAADIISAIAAGKEAAISIDRYLRGVDLKQGRQVPLEQVEWVSKKEVETKPRSTMPVIALEKRKDFAEVALGFDEKTAIAEAKRCLHCGRCFKACPYGAPQFGAEENAKMQKCNLCLDLGRWEEQKKPICIAACPLRALDAGPIDELTSKYGDIKEAEGLSYSPENKPSIIVRPKKHTKQ